MAKVKRVTHLKEFIKNTTFASFGVASYAKEECNEMVNSLVEMGKISGDDGERLLKNLFDRVNASKRIFEEKIDQITSQTINLLEKNCEEEINLLNQRIVTLESRINRLNRISA